MNDDKDQLKQLQALLERDQGERLGPGQNFVKTELPLILPINSSGYATDNEGHVVGLKLAQVTQEALDLALDFPRLQRLVFAARRNVEVPEKIALLRDLKFLWLGGPVKKLPEALLDLALPIYVDTPSKDLELSSGPEIFGHLKDLNDKLTPLAQVVEENSLPKRNVLPLNERNERAAQLKKESRELIVASLVLKGIFLSYVELEDPPLEIAAKGSDAIVSYYRNRELGDLPLNEVKVLLVGHGSAGKTSLVKRVFNDQFDPHETQTHGISIRKLDLQTVTAGKVKANFWDFGGQEIMHATHQFFLSKRSLYILVLDGRKEEDPEYWLQHIQSFGGDSPVMVVLNKIDEHPSFDVNRRFLNSKYPAIVGFFRVSCASGVGISEFKTTITQEMEKVPILRTRWPRNWFRVKEQLEKRESPYISVSDYASLCQNEHVDDQASQELLVDFLHDLGVILHFRDLQLLDTHVLDPLWVTEGVYRIINSELLADQNGLLRLDQLRLVLKARGGSRFSYSPQKYGYLIELMLKFELCYKIGASAILVPDLLNIQEPELGILPENRLEFVFQYKYLPKSIIPRFMVRMHRDIKGTMRWRTGVVLEDKMFHATAIVRSDEKESRIHVMVAGNQKRDYFAVIRKVISDINGSFEKLDVTELVPIPDAISVLIDYKELLGHELSSREEIFIGRLGKPYNVQALLNGIEEKNSRLSKTAATYINVEGNYFAQPNVHQLEQVVQTKVDRSVTIGGGSKVNYQPQAWEKILAYATSILFIGVVSFLAIRNQPIADRNIVVFIRTLLSLAVAIVGATVPGMLNVDIKSTKGLAIRASGALALFVLSFWLTPKVL